MVGDRANGAHEEIEGSGMKYISFGAMTSRRNSKLLGPAIFKTWGKLRERYGDGRIGAPELIFKIPVNAIGKTDFKKAVIGYKFKVPVYCRECEPEMFKTVQDAA